MTRELASTARFEKKREAILAAARDILYRHGLKGMTVAEVAEKVGLNAASVTYYFKKKEDLAVACYFASIAQLEEIIAEGEAREETERLRQVWAAFFAHHRAVRHGEASPLPSFGDVRALEEPHKSAVMEAFAAMARKARALFEGARFAAQDKKAKTALTHLLLEQMFWAIGWLYRYDVDDYPRVLARTCDIYLNGLGGEGMVWSGEVMRLPPEPRGASPDHSRDDFFIAATRVINRFGYRGASVEKISAELNVTKGSFYHHNEAKEDLVVACFRRSADQMRRAQRKALDTSGTQWQALERATATLIDFQMSDAGPLLREAVLQGLPDPLRISLNERLHRVIDRFAAIVADGSAEGSVRAVDPLIAAQMLKVTINAAAEGRTWIRELAQGEAVTLYGRPMLMGALR